MKPDAQDHISYKRHIHTQETVTLRIDIGFCEICFKSKTLDEMRPKRIFEIKRPLRNSFGRTSIVNLQSYNLHSIYQPTTET